VMGHPRYDDSSQPCHGPTVSGHCATSGPDDRYGVPEFPETPQAGEIGMVSPNYFIWIL
jgi:hypothetical protein